MNARRLFLAAAASGAIACSGTTSNVEPNQPVSIEGTAFAAPGQAATTVLELQRFGVARPGRCSSEGDVVTPRGSEGPLWRATPDASGRYAFDLVGADTQMPLDPGSTAKPAARCFRLVHQPESGARTEIDFAVVNQRETVPDVQVWAPNAAKTYDEDLITLSFGQPQEVLGSAPEWMSMRIDSHGEDGSVQTIWEEEIDPKSTSWTFPARAVEVDSPALVMRARAPRTVAGRTYVIDASSAPLTAPFDQVPSPREPASRGVRCSINGGDFGDCGLTDGDFSQIRFGEDGIKELMLAFNEPVKAGHVVLRGYEGSQLRVEVSEEYEGLPLLVIAAETPNGQTPPAYFDLALDQVRDVTLVKLSVAESSGSIKALAEVSVFP